MSKRDLRRLARILLQEYVKVLERRCGEVKTMKLGDEKSKEVKEKSNTKWWARGDLNPGPPPCQGGVLTRLDDGPSRSLEVR